MCSETKDTKSNEPRKDGETGRKRSKSMDNLESRNTKTMSECMGIENPMLSVIEGDVESKQMESVLIHVKSTFEVENADMEVSVNIKNPDIVGVPVNIKDTVMEEIPLDVLITNTEGIPVDTETIQSTKNTVIPPMERKNSENSDMLSAVGNFGRYQQIVTAMFCVMVFFPVFSIVIMYFAADTPSWRCSANSSACRTNGTFTNEDLRRCDLPRDDWEYTTPKVYSIVTQWDLDCDRKWLNSLANSIFFLGWLIGAPILGCLADNMGRKVVLTFSMNAILVVTFVTTFVPNIHFFIACRFIIGFFMNGTFCQMILIITGIVGHRHQTVTSLLIFTFVMVGLTIVGVKAYFIREWKTLYIVCSVPYVFTTIFYKFIPESLDYLYSKGKHEEIKMAYQRIASWNKKKCPIDMYIPRPVEDETSSNPIDLFKSKELAMGTILPALINFANVIVYYGLYFEAGNLGGSMYRDFMIITIPEAVFTFFTIYLTDRFGVRKVLFTLPMLATLSCLGLVFMAESNGYKIVRILLGMMGKCCNGVAFGILTSYATNLIPARYCSQAMGIALSFSRLGGLSAPWMMSIFTKIYKRLPYIAMTVMSVMSCCLILLLPKVPHHEVSSDDSQNDVTDVTDHVSAQTNVVIEMDMVEEGNEL